MKLYKFQQGIVNQLHNKYRCAIYSGCGTGKTIMASELLTYRTGKTLLVCQASKVSDWIEHFQTYYPSVKVFNLRKVTQLEEFNGYASTCIGVINYDLIYRREINRFNTLVLDESSEIKYDNTKKSRAILSLVSPKTSIILLSGTPCGGHYENLYTQAKLLGIGMTKTEYWNRYVVWYDIPIPGRPYGIKKVVGYKNVDDLMNRLTNCGAMFVKSEDVLDLPEQTFTIKTVEKPIALKRFEQDGVVVVKGKEYAAKNILVELTASRQLCNSTDKQQAFIDLVNSIDDRVVVFYNFDSELDTLKSMIKDRPVAEVNGHTNTEQIYHDNANAVLFVQYQAGARGLNLQDGNKIIYYSLTLSSDLFEQSKKRIHRIGTKYPCFYWILQTKNSVEESIYKSLNRQEDYNEELFRAYKRNTV